MVYSPHTEGSISMDLETAQRFEKFVDRSGECHEWIGGKNKDGYGRICIFAPGNRILAHRAAWILAFGPIAEGLCVCHSCDNPGCVNVDHLWLGTHIMNVQDMLDKGRGSYQAHKGVANGRAKITEQDVLDIRAEESTYPVLAEKYGISTPQIGKIKRRETWKHI
jgi:hypothetical protein